VAGLPGCVSTLVSIYLHQGKTCIAHSFERPTVWPPRSIWQPDVQHLARTFQEVGRVTLDAAISAVPRAPSTVGSQLPRNPAGRPRLSMTVCSVSADHSGTARTRPAVGLGLPNPGFRRAQLRLVPRRACWAVDGPPSSELFDANGQRASAPTTINLERFLLHVTPFARVLPLRRPQWAPGSRMDTTVFPRSLGTTFLQVSMFLEIAWRNSLPLREAASHPGTYESQDS
jgi:hypothetical protein